jgi:nucleoside-diphosphate-sugar epimerase
MQALVNQRINVFGGVQTRPNIHLRDMIRVYHHFLEHGLRIPGTYNAGFENITIRDIADRVNSIVPSEINVTPSNDPRSYRLSSKKLLSTGFVPKHSVEDGIRDVITAYRDGRLRDEERYYNIKTMKKLANLA